jgi:hypothetical protein
MFLVLKDLFIDKTKKVKNQKPEDEIKRRKKKMKINVRSEGQTRY